MSSLLLTAAWASFCLAIIFRGTRLWLCLGSPRPPCALVLLASAGGVVLSWETSLALVYEVVVLVTLATWQRRIFFQVLYCLLILRAFDAASVLAISLTTIQEGDIRTTLFLFGTVLFVTWGAVYTVEPILRRAERFVLESPRPHAGDTRLLGFLYSTRKGFGQLSWNRKGTLSAILFLTAASWFLEWLALYLVSPLGSGAAHAIISRIMLSLGFTSIESSTFSPYDVLMSSSYLLLFSLGLWSAWKGIKAKRKV